MKQQLSEQLRRMQKLAGILTEDWNDETWLLRNDGIDYQGKIKDIVNMAKKYPLVDIELSRIQGSPSYEKSDIERASNADYTKFPIVAVDLGSKNGIGVLDGNHRVFQARKDGKTKLKGYLNHIKDLSIYQKTE